MVESRESTATVTIASASMDSARRGTAGVKATRNEMHAGKLLNKTTTAFITLFVATQASRHDGGTIFLTNKTKKSNFGHFWKTKQNIFCLFLIFLNFALVSDQ